jgi:lipid II:glycine glycyltransferase (peptidoglycan interpeptide bridge formation enzyme)
MKIQIENKITKDIRKKSILQQTAFWSEVKRKQGIDSKAFDIKIKACDLIASTTRQDNVVDDLLILFQNTGNGYCIGYAPYGPTIKPSEENQGLFLEELSESLRPYMPANCIALRYDLLWESLWAKDDSYFDANGNWSGPPAKVTQELRLNFETRNWNLKKANTNILPTDTVFIDLRKEENTLLQEMKAKTRYNVRLSMRKGVKVRKADIQDLDIWYRLYKETCTRNRLFLHDIKFFQTILGTKARGVRSPADVELLIAEIDKKPLAAIFLVCSGQRATYLYGSSSSRNRRYMATYALQWEALRRARIKGCTQYDMFGVAPQPDPSHPLYGLYRFKVGFGGELFHRMGCWDYPLNQNRYDIYLAAEMNSTGYHLN